MAWHVYIIRCCDSTLYTGITSDLKRRIKEHKSGNGCRFTRCRTPVKLLYTEDCLTRPDALKREICIKRLPRLKKLALVKSIRIDKALKKKSCSYA